MWLLILKLEYTLFYVSNIKEGVRDPSHEKVYIPLSHTVALDLHLC